MNTLLSLWRKAASELRANKRLRYGMVLVTLVLLGEAGLRWSDHLSRQQAALAKLQTDLSALKSHARDEAALRAALEQTQRMAQAMDARLWQVSSEAVGQARLKDWLTEVVKRSIADQYAITLAASRELGKSGQESPGADATADKSALREFRANVSFRLTPRALEGVLLEIEGGEPFAAVETLVVKKQERRVELAVRVLMRIKAGEHV